MKNSVPELVGRVAEMRAIADAYDAGARLVTLTGPAGVGKTRVAREHASGPAGARFCALEDATDRDGVFRTTSSSTGRFSKVADCCKASPTKRSRIGHPRYPASRD